MAIRNHDGGNLRLFAAVIGGFLLFGAGCASPHLTNDEIDFTDPAFKVDEEAEIPDKPEVIDVLDVVAQYRMAVVEKNLGLLKRLVSRDYYDNAGDTQSTEDDWGWKELESNVLNQIAENTGEIQYEILVKGVEIRRKRALVDYEYNFSYRYDVGEKDTWDAGFEANRIVLEKREGEWLIVSGL